MYSRDTGLSFALYAYAASVLARAAAGARAPKMTKGEASRMVSSLLDAHGVAGGARLFDRQRVVGVMLGTAELFFEHREEGEALVCAALVYRFHGEPRPGVLEGFFDAESRGEADTGGGALDYRPESRSLLLTRTYLEPAPAEEFAADVRRLAAASLAWGGEVLERVAARGE
ncbi:MAG TPA: type III secretion system chaperone [Pyrinomonadaceae bacterium]|nr:type III secretion system chaperone [Pyrinomonadaceae bacterium]